MTGAARHQLRVDGAGLGGRAARRRGGLRRGSRDKGRRDQEGKEGKEEEEGDREDAQPGHAGSFREVAPDRRILQDGSAGVWKLRLSRPAMNRRASNSAP